MYSLYVSAEYIDRISCNLLNILFTEDPQTIAEFLRKRAFRMLGLDGKNLYKLKRTFSVSPVYASFAVRKQTFKRWWIS